MNFVNHNRNAVPITPTLAYLVADRGTQWDRLLSAELDRAIAARSSAPQHHEVKS